MPITGGSGGSSSVNVLDDLADVVITAAAGNDVLRYDGAHWVNIPSGGDWLSQYLLLAGRAGGQIIGIGAHASGAQYDIVIESRLMLGDNVASNAFTTGRVLDIRQKALNNTAQIFISYDATQFTGNLSGTWRGLFLQLSGTCGFTTSSAGASFNAMFMLLNPTIKLNTVVGEFIGSLYQVTPQETNDGGTNVYTKITGHKVIALGPSINNTLTGTTLLRGMNADVSNRAKAVDHIFNFDATCNSNGTGIGTDWILFGSSGAGFVCGTTNFYVLKYDGTISGAANKYGIWIGDAATKSVLAHSLTVGALTDPVHGLDVESSLGLKITANKNAAYNAAAETVIPCDAVGGAFAVNLPSAVGIAGRVYIVKKVDATANAVTLTPNGAETIDGAVNLVLNVQWQVARVISNGANWLVI